MNAAHSPIAAGWRVLVISLPTTAATARMRFWRAIKALGGAALRDGVYLVPDRAELLQPLQAIADDAADQDGKVWLLSVVATSDQEADYRRLFDRSAEYADWTAELAAARQAITGLGEAELLRAARRLGRGYDAIRRTDFFPGEATSIAEAKWRDFNAAVDATLSPGEPHGVAGAIARRDPTQYQGRRWATRRHLWVDRVACAWLIQRFIDPHATFLWLDDVRQCPDDALGFDFDGATFTHIGDRVSFEVLMASFGLDEDKGLSKLAQLVHVLDVGGAPVAEASGFEAVLTGARTRMPDDDALLQAMGPVLDSLYTHYGSASRRKR